MFEIVVFSINVISKTCTSVFNALKVHKKNIWLAWISSFSIQIISNTCTIVFNVLNLFRIRKHCNLCKRNHKTTVRKYFISAVGIKFGTFVKVRAQAGISQYLISTALMKYLRTVVVWFRLQRLQCFLILNKFRILNSMVQVLEMI